MYRLLSANVIRRCSVIPLPVCISCIRGTIEDTNHLMINYDIPRSIRSWMFELLMVNFSIYSDVTEIIQWVAKQNFKDTIGQLRLSCVLHGLWIIWTYSIRVPNNIIQQSVTIVIDLVTKLDFMHKGNIHNVSSNIHLCNLFKVKMKFKGGIIVKEVRLQKPQLG